jgi:ribosomal protein L16 Arg81 hydroxylase
MTCEIHSGDMLYIPPLWWHYIRYGVLLRFVYVGFEAVSYLEHACTYTASVLACDDSLI